MLYEYDGKDLIGRAFLDLNFFVISIRVVKYYILIGDLSRGMQFAVWDPIVKQLQLLGATAEWFNVLAVDYLFDHRALNLIGVDDLGNLYSYRFAPSKPPENGHFTPTAQPSIEYVMWHYHAQKLTLRSDYNTAAQVTALNKMKIRNRKLNNTKTQTNAAAAPIIGRSVSEDADTVMTNAASPTSAGASSLAVSSLMPGILASGSTLSIPASSRIASVRSLLIMAAIDGSMHTLSPIDELVYRRLSNLHNAMTNTLPQVAALNPKAFRLATGRASNNANRRGVVDGAMMKRFAVTDTGNQEKLAASIGTSADFILDNIKNIHFASALH